MKLFKNRTVLGIVCILVSLVVCFAVTPLVNAGLAKKTTVVRMLKDAKSGDEIKKNMVKEVEVGNYNLPDNVYHSVEEVVGQYLTIDVCREDMLFSAKTSKEPTAENVYLYRLNGEKQAISITINTFAEGLSGKLEGGDIVSVIAPNYQGMGETVVPLELQYVEVIAVTAKSGTDTNTEIKEEEKELPSTVTLLVSREQSKILARLESEGEIHLSLVYRGTKEQSEQFLLAQEEVIIKLLSEENEEIEGREDTMSEETVEKPEAVETQEQEPMTETEEADSEAVQDKEES